MLCTDPRCMPLAATLCRRLAEEQGLTNSSLPRLFVAPTPSVRPSFCPWFYAALCRRLKEEQGLSNSSPEVAAEVEKLLGLKQQLQALQDAAAAAGSAAAEA